MAKKPQRRRRRLRVAATQVALALSTLADDTVLSEAENAVDNEQFLISVKATYTIRDVTAGEGPITIGWAHGDYSDTEIQESLATSGSWDEGNKTANEQANRAVRKVGTFHNLSAEGVLNNGNPITTKLMFKLQTGISLKFWAWNRSGAILTTGAVCNADGDVFMRPL